MSKTEKFLKQQQKNEKAVKQEIKTVQTTKPEIRSEPAHDFFAIYNQNIEKYFESVENSIPKYYQTLTELQEEYIQAFEKIFKATISVQKEFVSKTGLSIERSTEAGKFISSVTESAIKARTVRDEIILSSIDTVKENVKEWNKRSQDFVDLNRKIMQQWISSFTTRKN